MPLYRLDYGNSVALSIISDSFSKAKQADAALTPSPIWTLARRLVMPGSRYRSLGWLRGPDLIEDRLQRLDPGRQKVICRSKLSRVAVFRAFLLVRR
jgi:hypothetical protein